MEMCWPNHFVLSLPPKHLMAVHIFLKPIQCCDHICINIKYIKLYTKQKTQQVSLIGNSPNLLLFFNQLQISQPISKFMMALWALVQAFIYFLFNARKVIKMIARALAINFCFLIVANRANMLFIFKMLNGFFCPMIITIKCSLPIRAWRQFYISF